MSNTPFGPSGPPPGAKPIQVNLPAHLLPLRDGFEAKMKEFARRFKAATEAPDEATRRAEAGEARIALGGARLAWEELLVHLPNALPPEQQHLMPAFEQQRGTLDTAAEMLADVEAGRVFDITPQGNA